MPRRWCRCELCGEPSTADLHLCRSCVRSLSKDAVEDRSIDLMHWAARRARLFAMRRALRAVTDRTARTQLRDVFDSRDGHLSTSRRRRARPR